VWCGRWRELAGAPKQCVCLAELCVPWSRPPGGGCAAGPHDENAMCGWPEPSLGAAIQLGLGLGLGLDLCGATPPPLVAPVPVL
jgi:hypothetical protein